ncbi:hypothetical protein PC123_g23011 [Phytophthora cactorum]|nr:hypothetical protein PC123_g23011 [Phytophthora cactorum]
MSGKGKVPTTDKKAGGPPAITDDGLIARVTSLVESEVQRQPEDVFLGARIVITEFCSTAAFDSVVTLIPPADRQRRISLGPDYPTFEEWFKQVLRADNEDKASPKSAKKQRVGSPPRASIFPLTSSSPSRPPSPQPYVGFEYTQRAPPEVHIDLERLYKSAHTRGTPLERTQYLWGGQRHCYDPDEFPDIYSANWRCLMAIRYVAWKWGLLAPLPDSTTQAQRRKRKMQAIAERLRLTNKCLETWGYYGFLHRLKETGNRNLFWWGGHPGRSHSDRQYRGPIVMLFRTDKVTYLKKIQWAFAAFKLDCDGFESLPSLLTYTDALGPNQA